MKHQEIWRDYYFYTGEITKHARFLGFAGFAVCWFFRTPAITFPPLILAALMGLVVYFLLDLLQYYVAAFRLRSWMTGEEKCREPLGTLEEEDYRPPVGLDDWTLRLFHSKLAVLLIALGFVGAELIARMRLEQGG